MNTQNPFAGSNATSSLLATDMVKNLDGLVEALVQARSAKGYSPEDVARRIGYEVEDVLEFEQRDLSPSLEFVVAYSIAVSVHVLFQASDGESWARGKRAMSLSSTVAE